MARARPSDPNGEPRAAPQWPDGVAVRGFEPGRDERAVHAAVQEAFADNAGPIPMSFEDWHSFMIDRKTFDPTQWFLAVDGGEIAGVALCPEYGEPGCARQLAVRRRWRRRGIAVALLRNAFAEFYRRGKRRAGLATGSFNRTGSLALSRKAGMRIARRYVRYEKETGN